MAEWNRVTIQDITTVLGDGLHGTPKYTDDGEYAFVNGNNLINGKIVIKKDTKRVDHTQFEKYQKPLDNRTIMVSINGTLGNVAIYNGEKIVLGKSACYFNVKEEYDKEFVKYIVSSKTFKNHLENNATGTTIKNISLKQMREYEFDIPSYELQCKISGILKNIDDKIENNEAINRNLAEQSQLVVKLFWETNESGMNPLSEIADVIDCLHSKKPEQKEDGNKQLIQLNNITDDGFLDLTYRYMISDDDYANWTRKCEIQESDCVITNVGRVGAVSQAPAGTHAAMGRNMTCIRLKKNCQWPSYLITMLLSNHIKKEIYKNTDVGTIMNALNVKDIPKLKFPVFSTERMGELEAELFPLRKMIENNYVENQRLSSMRDSLLPRLMSGELDVSEIDI